MSKRYRRSDDIHWRYSNGKFFRLCYQEYSSRFKCCFKLSKSFNSITPAFANFVNFIWTTCDTESLSSVLMLQKRLTRIFLFAQRQSPVVSAFNIHHLLFITRKYTVYLYPAICRKRNVIAPTDDH